MNIPPSSEKSCGGAARLYRNSSFPPSPLLIPALRHPTLHIISYNHATILTTPPLLQYDLQSKTDRSRHICVNPSIGLPKSTKLELCGEPHYASQLLVAEKEIRNAMEHLQRPIVFHTHSSSNCS